MIVDLTKLSQQQRWGLQFALLQSIQEGEPSRTEQQYADQVFALACESWYSQLIEAKKAKAFELFDALTPEQQAQLVEQLQIPDILPTE